MNDRPNAITVASLRQLPVIRTSLAPGAVVDRLESAAKKGKLPGFERAAPTGSFEVSLLAEPFDRVLSGSCTAEGSDTLIRFSARVSRRVPIIFAVVTALAIWPGVWLTDSMLKTYFTWYTIPTWWWYLPLTIIPLPFYFKKAIARSTALALESAGEQLTQIRDSVSGILAPGSNAR